MAWGHLKFPGMSIRHAASFATKSDSSWTYLPHPDKGRTPSKRRAQLKLFEKKGGPSIGQSTGPKSKQLKLFNQSPTRLVDQPTHKQRTNKGMKYKKRGTV